MKLQYLGTAAAERIPAMFCSCEACKRALAAGGRNIMSRAQALVNDDLLIDFSGDTYLNFMRVGKTLTEVEYLLITHAHEDHFTFEDFFSRFDGIAYNVKTEKLKVYLSSVAYSIMKRCIKERGVNEERLYKRFEFTEVLPYAPFTVGEYVVTALPARHASEGEAFIYLIERDGKTIFYGNDTGYFSEEIDEYLAGQGKKIDLLSLDCTKCDKEFDYYTHMSMSEGRRIADRFVNKGLLNEGAKLYFTHFSHNSGMIYDDMKDVAMEKYGFLLAYDGLTLELD